MPTEIDIAYLAGIVDGEGSVVIHKTRPNKKSQDKTHRYVIDIKIGMSDQRVIYWIQQNFGGSVNVVPRENPKYRTMYQWQIRANKASALLKGLLPHLKVKSLQASLAIYFQDCLIRKTGWKGDGISPEELQERDKIYEMNRMLNKGYDPEVMGGYHDC